jgi:ABC-2 type transport system ATP-binding protein
VHDAALDFIHVGRNYGHVQALRDVSFEARKGEVVALLGPNGAGKSTAIALMLGLRAPSFGRVTVLGEDPRREGTRGRIGAMLQETALPPGVKVAELLAFQRSLYPRPLPFDAVVERGRVGDLLGLRVERLSGGQRRRVLFALAVAGDPEVLFLDEPTAGMDTESRAFFWREMDELSHSGRTILFTTHYLEEADRHARRILLLQGGRLAVDATPEQMRRRTGESTMKFSISPDWVEKVAGLLPDCRVAAHGPRVSVVTADAEAALRVLFAHDVPLHGLEVTAGSLEEALLQLQEGGDDR